MSEPQHGLPLDELAHWLDQAKTLLAAAGLLGLERLSYRQVRKKSCVVHLFRLGNDDAASTRYLGIPSSEDANLLRRLVPITTSERAHLGDKKGWGPHEIERLAARTIVPSTPATPAAPARGRAWGPEVVIRGAGQRRKAP